MIQLVVGLKTFSSPNLTKKELENFYLVFCIENNETRANRWRACLTAKEEFQMSCMTVLYKPSSLTT
uniref:Uncharacterized protein n=1 Tax=Rhizophora mucronata TaxID=61149 RepID=A0A2P2KNE9_RHIMU